MNTISRLVAGTLLAASAAAALAHTLESIAPPAGAEGQVLFIAGSGFTAGKKKKPKVWLTPGTPQVLKKKNKALKVPLKVTQFDDGEIRALLKKTKKGMQPGPYNVHVAVKGQDEQVFENGFTLSSIELVSITPENARPGDTITIEAANNGTKKGKIAIQDPVTGKQRRLKVKEWVPGQIEVKLPKKLPDGDYSISAANRIGEAVLEQALAVGDVIDSEFLTFDSNHYENFAATAGFPQANSLKSAGQFISQLNINGQRLGPDPVLSVAMTFQLFFDGSLDDLQLPKTFIPVQNTDRAAVDGEMLVILNQSNDPTSPPPIIFGWLSDNVTPFTFTLTRIESGAVEGTFSGSLRAGSEVDAPVEVLQITDGELRALLTNRQQVP